MTTDVDAIQTNLNPRRRWAVFSIRVLIVLIAAVAAALAGYRHWVDYHTIVARNHPAEGLIPVPIVGTLEPLVDEITATIQPATWRINGGDATIIPFYLNGSIIVKNNLAAQRQGAAFLEDKRSEMKRRRR